jgi:hypothetical protein
VNDPKATFIRSIFAGMLRPKLAHHNGPKGASVACHLPQKGSGQFPGDAQVNSGDAIPPSKRLYLSSAHCSQWALRLFDLGEHDDLGGFAEQLRAVAVAYRCVEKQRDALLVSENEPPVHTRVEVSDLWVLRG